MTWTIEMNNQELCRKTEIERVLEKRTTQSNAASKLGLSERQFRRKLRGYREKGVSGIVSKKRGIPSNRKTEETVMEAVRSFICDPLRLDFGLTTASTNAVGVGAYAPQTYTYNPTTGNISN